MPYSAVVHQVFVASPGDVTPERLLIEQEVANWNSRFGSTYGIRFEVKRWERDAVPQQGQRGQAEVNEQLVDPSDLLIAVFWTRLGSPSGVSGSGTIEEIIRFHDSGKPHAILFKMADIPIGHDNNELKRLEEFKQKIRDDQEGEFRGLTKNFKTNEELKEIVEKLLSHHAQKYSGERNPAASNTQQENPMYGTQRESRSFSQVGPDFGAIETSIRSRKACLSCIEGGSIHYNGSHVKTKKKFRNEGQYPAYDVQIEVVDDAGRLLGSTRVAEIIPATSVTHEVRSQRGPTSHIWPEVEFSLPDRPDSTESTSEYLFQIHCLFRDGLGEEDEAIFFFKAVPSGSEWKVVEDRSLASLSSFCRFVRPQSSAHSPK